MNSLYRISLILFSISIINAIEITLHGYIYVPSVFHETLAERANKYLKSKGLDITLKTNFENPLTGSINPAHIANFIEQSILKKDEGYDLYVTDTVYTGRFVEHFEDLTKYVHQDVIDLYKDGTATKTCYVDTKLAGLPLMVDYGGLYSNMNLLNKYNRTVPETWDELIETTNYIYDLEIKENPNLRKFIGHFPSTENGLVTILQFFHSFRDSSTDSFPEYTSQNAIDALVKAKEVKDLASTPDDFATPDSEISKLFKNENFIFLLFWYIGDQYSDHNYKFSPLPGKKKGISASCVGGSNISMNKYISEEKKKAAGEVLSFINSYEQQKYLVMNTNSISAIYSTYSDPEICQKIDCIMFSSLQSIVRPSSSTINYEQYSNRFRELVTEYLYDETDKSAKEILIEIDDIRRIYFVEINSMTSIIVLLINLVAVALIFYAFIFATNQRFNNQFVFLPYGYWYIVILGLLLVAIYPITGINALNNYKCTVRPMLLSLGFSLLYIPMLLKMISIFPKRNGASNLVKEHYGLFFIIFIIIDVVLNIVWCLEDPFVVNKLMVTTGKNFQYCNTTTGSGRHMKYAVYNLKAFTLIIMGILTFAEWNLAAFKSDIRSITTSLYNTLLMIFLLVFVEKININDRYVYFATRAIIVLFFCISTALIIFGTKYYYIYIKKEQLNIYSFSNNKSSSGLKNSSIQNSTIPHKTQKSTLFNIHYQTGTTDVPQAVASKPYPSLFSSTINTNYNGNLFNNSSSNTTSQSSDNLHSYSSNTIINNYKNNNDNNNYNYNNNYSNNYSNNYQF